MTPTTGPGSGPRPGPRRSCMRRWRRPTTRCRVRKTCATLTGLTDPDAMLDFYLRLGSKVVLLKMGQAGAYLGTPDARIRIPAHPVTAVDATGAGDTFCGSFLARILAGDEPEAAARYASVAAALKCTGYGAVGPIPTAAEVWVVLGCRAIQMQPTLGCRRNKSAII